jgi:hypothetical protein
MNILVWKSKYGDTIVAARTPEEEGRAWLYLFKQMDEIGYYRDLDGAERGVWLAAMEGVASAAKRLLSMRNGGEYEQVTIESVVEP